jgi:mannan endo-1,4-beta-mannosidase
MAAYVKAQAPNQLVTVGSEGFFARGSRWEAANPANWAADMGQDFMANNAVAGIDFATLHVWPDNWNT